ncbi:MAG: metallophosphoesterase [Verrucomicrobiae bacterium]|nr:metallophosphoesterase [Verrucomicrobiae bacterium]
MKIRDFIFINLLVVLLAIHNSEGAGAPTNIPPILTNLTHPVKIALISDIHINHGTNQALYQANYEKVIAQVNNEKVDAVIISGDLTEDGTSKEYSDFKKLTKQFISPVFFIPGNHDIGNKQISGKKGEINFKRLTDFHLKLGKSWFSTDCGDVKIVGANSCLMGSGFQKEEQMWKFLEKQMPRKPIKPIIFVTHHPLYEKKIEEKGGEYWNVEPAERFRLMGLFQQSGVVAALSGHLHRPVTNNYNGVLYYTTHPVAFGLPKGKQKPGWTLITVSSNGINLKPFFIETNNSN